MEFSIAGLHGDGGESLGFEQPVLPCAVERLNLSMGGERSPVQLELKLTDPPWKALFRQRRVKVSHPCHP